MVMRTKRSSDQRGAAAVEFAMVVPIFIALLGFIISVGAGLWARYQMVGYATAAARACAFSVPTTDQSVLPCAQRVVNQELAAQPITWCNGTPSAAIWYTTNLTANTGLHFLNIRLTCQMRWNPMVNAIQGSTLGGSAYQVVANASMPYLLPNY